MSVQTSSAAVQETATMTAISQDGELHFASHIQSLIREIRLAFPPRKLDFLSQVAINCEWVDAARFEELLCGKMWDDVSMEAFSRLDSTAVRVNLSPLGMTCYLPMFMAYLLATRGFGWFEELLLPVGLGLEEVVEQFSGSMLEDPENSFRERYRERVVYAKKHLFPEQFECVAKYIEIAEGYGIENPTPEFQKLLKKYADFWRTVPLSPRLKDG